jgi:hypothetical protein
MSVEPFWLVFAVAALIVNIMRIIRFFRIADDVKRLADTLAPKPQKAKPEPPPELTEWQRKNLLPEFRDDGATKKALR